MNQTKQEEPVDRKCLAKCRDGTDCLNKIHNNTYNNYCHKHKLLNEMEERIC